KDWLEARGVERRKIHFELFHTLENAPAGEPEAVREAKATAQAGLSRVTIRLDGLSHAFDLAYDGTSVLEAALWQGIDLPFACKGGVCCTCRAKLLEGKVEMDHNYALEADELEAGYILTCQSHPRSAKLVIDFDAK
ncbi:MAG TPA: 2Fe-2S iron-sulfur cluster-binding protein, partial [Puia sp.]|nr:2Fe-2S iron-sulfur cluster-binding protein [Puia sp.]